MLRARRNVGGREVPMKKICSGMLRASMACGAMALAGCASVTNVDTFKYGFLEVTPNKAAGTEQPRAEELQLRAKSWKHEWRCSVFDNCETDFVGSLYVFDARTGRQVRWNRVEVFLKDDCDASPSDRARYKTVADTDHVTLGWGEERKGRYENVSAYLVFYADWGSVNARVRSKVCP
jgi:hypothetical protein